METRGCAILTYLLAPLLALGQLSLDSSLNSRLLHPKNHFCRRHSRLLRPPGNVHLHRITCVLWRVRCHGYSQEQRERRNVVSWRFHLGGVRNLAIKFHVRRETTGADLPQLSYQTHGTLWPKALWVSLIEREIKSSCTIAPIFCPRYGSLTTSEMFLSDILWG